MLDSSRPSQVKASKAERQQAAEVIMEMQESGEYKRLQEQLLANILHDNPEWWDAIRLRTREILQAKDGSGVLDISMDELSAKLIVTGKEAVSDEVKKSTLLEIQNQLTHKQKESCR